MNSQAALEANSMQYQKQQHLADVSQSDGPGKQPMQCSNDAHRVSFLAFAIESIAGPSNLRRSSRPVNESSRPMLGSTFSQSSIDHYDHYKRPPSRDSSVDRYSRALAAGRQSGSRQASIDRSIMQPNIPSTAQPSDAAATDRNARAGSAFRNMASVAMSPAAPISQNGKCNREAWPTSGRHLTHILYIRCAASWQWIGGNRYGPNGCPRIHARPSDVLDAQPAIRRCITAAANTGPGHNSVAARAQAHRKPLHTTKAGARRRSCRTRRKAFR